MNWAKDGATWPLSQHSRFVLCKPHRWHVQEAGSGPAVLLIHGAGGATHSWRHLFPLLIPHFRVIAVDLPGQGFTQLGAQHRCGLDPMAEDLLSLCQSEDIAPDVIIGHSAGAAIALRMAEMLHPSPPCIIGINAALGTFEGLAGVLFPALAKTIAMLPMAANLFSATASDHSVRRIIKGTGSTLPPEDINLYRRLVADPTHVSATLQMMYVVAVVALEEASDVRLTTNIVGCDPDAVHIGQEVAVRFERYEDVWLPLFEPTGTTHPNPVEEPALPAPRPPLREDRFEHRAVLSGIGRSKIGRRLMVDPLSLTVDACVQAVADAGLSLDDIDGLSTYPGMVGMGMSEGGVTAVEEALRLRPTWINGGGDIPGPGGAVIAAMLAVAGGLCRHVLCFRTVWESTFAKLGLRGGFGTRVSDWMQWRMPFGAMSAAHWIGMNANQYMHRYGATRELLGHIAINGRTNAARNPAAIYRDPMTMDDYLSARPITSPFGLYDCDVPCDGSIAVIVSDASVAADLPKPAVRIEAVGTQILERVSWDQGTITHEPQVLGQAAHLWTRTSLRPDDVDLALVYDGFTFNAISWLEALGFCEIGEAKEWIDGGRRIALDGDLPVNPHGGQLSEGRTHGFGFLYEGVAQLRHEADERQVPNARTAVVSTGGGTPSGVLLLQRHRA